MFQKVLELLSIFVELTIVLKSKTNVLELNLNHFREVSLNSFCPRKVMKCSRILLEHL